MRGTGPVGVNGQTVYAYFTQAEDRVRVRISVDESDRLGLVEGLRVLVALPGRAGEDSLILAASRVPPYVWLELESLAPRATVRAG